MLPRKHVEIHSIKLEIQASAKSLTYLLAQCTTSRSAASRVILPEPGSDSASTRSRARLGEEVRYGGADARRRAKKQHAPFLVSEGFPRLVAEVQAPR